MKYSVLLTCYDPENKLLDMSLACIKSVLENSAGEDYEFIIDTGPKPGLQAAYNRLFRAAHGDFLIVIPNDTIIMDKDWLRKLAVPGFVTSWHISTFLQTGAKEPDGGVTCYPRDIVEKVGFYDEEYDKGYGFGDNDWFHRANQLGVQYLGVDVKIKHEGNTTYQTYWGSEKQKEMYLRNEKYFKEKWNLK